MAEYIIEADQMAEHLSRVVQFPTISHSREADMDFEPFYAMQEYLEKIYPLLHRTLKKEIVGKAGLLYLWQGTGKSKAKPLMLMAHQDVVPVGDLSKWTYPPFSGTIRDGQVWGRGASDVKSLIIAHMEAIEYLLSVGYCPDYDIYLAYGYNEEVNGGEDGDRSSAKMVAEIMRSRGIQLGGVIDEGTSARGNGYCGVEGDVCVIGVGEKGYADYEIVYRGKGGHTGAPHADNPTTKIAQAIMAIAENPYPYRITPENHLELQLYGRSMKDRERAELFLHMDERWDEMKEYLDKDPFMAGKFHTTMAVSMLRGSDQANVLPDTASLIVNCRLLPEDTLDSVKEYLKSIVPEGADIRLLKGCNPSPTSSLDSRLYRLIPKMFEDRHPDMPVFPDYMLGGMDAKHMTGLTDNVYRFLPFFINGASGSGVHGVNECMTISDLVTGPDFYIKLLPEYGK